MVALHIKQFYTHAMSLYKHYKIDNCTFLVTC